MTVAELAARLSELPQHALVVFVDPALYRYHELLEIKQVRVLGEGEPHSRPLSVTLNG